MARGAARLVLPLLVYVLGVALLAFAVYKVGKQHYLDEVDTRLTHAARQIPALVPEDFHDQALNAKAIREDEDRRNMAELSRHANTGGFAYLYFYVVDQGMVYFTASSATAEDYLNNEASTYWTSYPEGPPEFWRAAESEQPVYVSNTDRWGSFRTALVPLRSPAGRRYVAGADMNISVIEANLWRQAVSVAGLGLVMLLLAVPMMLAFRRMQLDLNTQLVQLNNQLQGDIVHAHAIEEELRRATEAAQTADACKSQFLANMSHDIRTPLHGMLGLLEILQRTADETRRQDYLEQAHKNGRVLLGTIDRLLDFAAADSGRLAPRVEAVPMRRYGDELAELFAPLLAQRRLDLLVHVTHSVPDRLNLDPVLLRQVLVNLIGNAVKFTERGHVEAVLIWHQDVLSGRVSDTGPGIPEASRARIFEPFQQADNSLSRRNSGTGLGLPLARSLCQTMGGGLWLERSGPQGSSFAFRILASRAENGEPARRAQDSRPLLVLSPFTALGPWLKDCIEPWGIPCHHATRYAEAPETLLNTAWLIVDAALGEPLLEELVKRLPDAAPRLAWLDWAGHAAPASVPASSRRLSKPLSRAALADWLSPRLAAAADTAAAAPAPAAEGHVLIVEDNEINRLIAVKVLNRAGLHTDTAGSGLEALELCRSRRYDAILMDIQMAGMDGLETTRQLHLEWGEQTPPIIGLSAHVFPEHIAEARAAGMCDYLSKPFKHEELVARVRRWMSKAA